MRSISMFKPFENATESHSIHDLTLENDIDRVNIYGNLQLSKDQAGLDAAKALQAFLNSVVGALEAEVNLPQQIQTKDSNEVENPFL